MGSTNFLQFNPAQMNQETDAAYTSDATRTGGAAVGAAFTSPLGNKLFYQLSTFVAAFGQMLAAKGYTAADTDITALQATLANIQTLADERAPLVVLSFSATPAYNAAAISGFQMQLTGNLTAPTISGQTAGQTLQFAFQQDATGGRTVAWPAGFVDMPQVNPAPNAWTLLEFFVTNDLTVRLASPPAGVPASPLAIMPGRAYGVPYGPLARTSLVVVFANSSGGPGANSDLEMLYGPNAGALVACDGNGTHNGGGNFSVSYLVPAGYYYQVNATTSYGGTADIVAWSEMALN